MVGIAVRQRAKFEGWLKFELAARAELHGAQGVEVEATSTDSGDSRHDVTFSYAGQRYDVELKTCNTNWRTEGVLNLTRPITKNVDAIIVDGKKLGNCAGNGIAAFCMFPVPCDDNRWTDYLFRIGKKLGVTLRVDRHTSRVSIRLGSASRADVIVVAFTVPVPEAPRSANWAGSTCV